MLSFNAKRNLLAFLRQNGENPLAFFFDRRVYLRLRRLVRQFFFFKLRADETTICGETLFVLRSRRKKIIFPYIADINQIYGCHFIISSVLSSGAATASERSGMSDTAERTVSSARAGVLFSFER